MEVNPYLATTGGLFELSWETDLNKSYVMSQQIYIDCIYGVSLFSLVPLVWNQTQNSRVAGASPTTSVCLLLQYLL